MSDQAVTFNKIAPVDDDRYTDMRLALEDNGARYGETPYGATKTAELDVQFSIDPSYGLSRERYGWYSDGVMFDETNFDTTASRIQINTSATDGASSAFIRSAYPGQYTSHTISEPGLGAELNSNDVEFDENNRVSLTHGEISLEVGSLDTDTRAGINAHGISFEEDGTYHQVRVDGQNVAFIPQEDWNIDPMDGTGPSGEVLKPEEGYVYQFIYSWYGAGAMILAIQDPAIGKLIPLNSYVPEGNQGKPPVTSPNLPLQALVENKGTADPLHLIVGGMQYATHGKGQAEATTRATEEARHDIRIGDTATLNEESVDPYSSTLTPLVAATRQDDPEVQKGLRFELGSILLDADSPCYLFVFDEFDTAATGLDGTFTRPTSRNGNIDESKILTNTTATTYNPGSTTSTLRAITYVPSSKNSPSIVTESNTSSRIPLDATLVVAGALAPGSNATTADPIKVSFREGF